MVGGCTWNVNTSLARSPLQNLSVLVGPGIAILVTWLLTLPDSRDTSGVTLANVALLVGLISVGFAVVDWLAGATTSVAAALSLNFFHTEPLRTLRITDRRDVYSVVLLGSLGLVVSAVTATRVRREVSAVQRENAISAGHAMVTVLATDQPAAQMWAAAINAASNDLSLVGARLASNLPSGMPNIRRQLVQGDDQVVTLPSTGAAIALCRDHDVSHWLVVTPRAGHGPLDVDRRAVLTFADAIELALDAEVSSPTGVLS